MRCSHYVPSSSLENTTPLPCVIYCHGNRYITKDFALLFLGMNENLIHDCFWESESVDVGQMQMRQLWFFFRLTLLFSPLTSPVLAYLMVIMLALAGMRCVFFVLLTTFITLSFSPK